MSNAMTDETTAERIQAGNPAGAVWLLRAFSGFLLVLLLLLHMVAQHFVAPGGLRTFDEVVAYVSNPLIFTITILFLVTATGHGLLGLRAIILDLGLGKPAQRAINWFLAIVGLVAIAYGIWLEVTIVNM
jgi:succinate dehydrogenase / fumarate reductase membrane anchor subunit